MEFTEIVKGLEFFSIPAPLIASVLLLVGMAWMCWRARSLMPIIRRIWRWVAGSGSAVSDEEVQRTLAEEVTLDPGGRFKFPRPCPPKFSQAAQPDYEAYGVRTMRRLPP